MTKEQIDAFLAGKSEQVPDPAELLVFAAKEAYCHIRGRAPDVAADDEFANESRCASFVCEALLAAIYEYDPAFVDRADEINPISGNPTLPQPQRVIKA